MYLNCGAVFGSVAHVSVTLPSVERCDFAERILMGGKPGFFSLRSMVWVEGLVVVGVVFAPPLVMK